MECVLCGKLFDESDLMIRGNIAGCLECSQKLFNPKAPCDPDANRRVTFVALKQANLSGGRGAGEGESR